jgi:hypothetical protein
MQYEKPSVADYGTLRELTAALSGLPMGMVTISSPLVPGTPPGGPDTPGASSSEAGGSPPGLTPAGGGSGGDQASGGGGAGGGGIAGSETGGGGSGSGSGAAATGGGDASLPFTGFAVAMVGAIGAGMAATGTAVRRMLRRRDSSS